MYWDSIPSDALGLAPVVSGNGRPLQSTTGTLPFSLCPQEGNGQEAPQERIFAKDILIQSDQTGALQFPLFILQLQT